MSFTFLVIAVPIVILVQHFLGRWLMRRVESGVVESTAVGESPAAAHVIPKRAFRGVQEAERFYQLSRTRNEAAT